MLLNRLRADWQKYLYCYLSGTVLVTIESRWYSAETHCEQGPGTSFWSVKLHCLILKRIIIIHIVIIQYIIQHMNCSYTIQLFLRSSTVNFSIKLSKI